MTTAIPEYDRLVRLLLGQTGASRTTIRLANDEGIPLLVAEACAPGVGSMRNLPQTIDIVLADTYQYLERERTELIQPDCRTDELRPPRMLTEDLKVRAQMLAPIVVRGELAGSISVHQQDVPRCWAQADIAALRSARLAVESGLRSVRGADGHSG